MFARGEEKKESHFVKKFGFFFQNLLTIALLRCILYYKSLEMGRFTSIFTMSIF